jgi:hypothetical protein
MDREARPPPRSAGPAGPGAPRHPRGGELGHGPREVVPVRRGDLCAAHCRTDGPRAGGPTPARGGGGDRGTAQASGIIL